MARSIKQSAIMRFMSYNRHTIYYDMQVRKYLVAIKRDGTDDYFDTFDEAMDAIDKIEEVRA